MKVKNTHDAKKGGLFVGDSHAEGGIPAIVTDTGKPIEVEGGEVIINKEASKKFWKELSAINTAVGGGVPIPPPAEFSKEVKAYKKGGKISISQLKIGTEMEMEHKHTIEQYKEKGVSVEEVARHIAEDHLKENPNYYKILRKLKLAKGGIIVCRKCSNDWESNEKNKFRFVCKKCGTNNKKYYTSSTEKKKFEDGGSINSKPITSRQKPNRIIYFNPPLIGKNGNKLIAYEWKYEYVVDFKKGEEILKRISDWSNSSKNEETGRDIVHQFIIETPNKEIFHVSAESIPSNLGLVNSTSKKSITSISKLSKTLAFQKLELEALSLIQNKIEEIKDYYQKNGFPDIKIEKSNYEGMVKLVMGDGSCHADESNPFEPERIECVKSSFIREELNKMGIKSTSYLFKINELKSKIKTKEDKLNELISITDYNDKFEEGGSIEEPLLAPNGKPSNLTPEQYKIVRTPEFKAWFGDWEKLTLTKINDSGIDEVSLKRLEDSVSKVVDENGEPLVVYHGTGTEFYIFDKKTANDAEGRKYGVGTGKGVFSFTDDFSIAENWMNRSKERSEYGVNSTKPRIIEAFLNFRNPTTRDDFENRLQLKFSGYTFKPQKERDAKIAEIYKEYKKLKIDGLISDFGEYTAFYPNQIKLADGTNTTFNPKTDDIRFAKGGVIPDKELYEEWKELVNMTYSELKEFYDSKEGKEAGLSASEGKELGIHTGRESARWIMKMKQTPVSDWTNEMWEWCKRQIRFIKRMEGNKGELYNEDGTKTRKHTSLLIWGHNPEKYAKGGKVPSTPEAKAKIARVMREFRNKELYSSSGDLVTDREQAIAIAISEAKRLKQ